METWIALLKGVNVGGHNRLPMAEFRTLLGGLGCANIATYIQSGNAVFRAAGTAGDIADNIKQAVADQFGFQAEVFVMGRSDLGNALVKNPFTQAATDPKTLHLFFLPEIVNLPDQAMTEYATKGEEFSLMGRVLYLYTPNGFGRSKLVEKLPRLIPVPMTGRNLRSCQKIDELAQAI